MLKRRFIIQLVKNINSDKINKYKFQITSDPITNHKCSLKESLFFATFQSLLDHCSSEASKIKVSAGFISFAKINPHANLFHEGMLSEKRPFKKRRV